MKAALAVAVSVVVLSLPLFSYAELVAIEWDAQGEHASKLVTRAGRVVEVCGKLAKGQSVDWFVEASTSLDFNIHFHVGDKVEYPEKRTAVRKLEGRLVAPLDQDYCWMWEVPASGPAAIVELRLQRR